MDNDEKAAILKAELDAGHPVTGAYNADDFIATDECNAVNVVRDRAILSAAVIFDEILKQKGEWDAVATDLDRELVLAILDINKDSGISTLSGSPARTQLIAILGTVTKAAIAALIPETVSQMTVLGLGDSIKIGSVQNARAL